MFKEVFFCGIKFDTLDIMKRVFLFTLLSAFGLSSCLIADNMFLEYSPQEESLNSKVEKEITTYLIQNTENYIYKSYGFSELIIKKPAELVALDDLKRKHQLDTTRIDLKQQITKLDSIIKSNNIRYSLEIDHEYSLKNKTTKIIELFETKFKLADSIKISDIKPLLNLKLSDEDVVIFENYFYETPIISSGTYAESKALSVEFYNHFKQRQNNLIGSKQKSNFLKHTLNLCKDVKVDGTFDQSYFLLKTADKKMRTDTTLSNYKSIEYSPLFETIIDKKVVNYYFFHSFMSTKENYPDTLSVYIEFSPYYELRMISPSGKKYNTFFND